MQKGHILVRRNDVDAIGLGRHAALYFHHPHVGGALQQVGQHALALRIEMLDDHEGHVAVVGNVLQTLLIVF